VPAMYHHGDSFTGDYGMSDVVRYEESLSVSSC